MAMTWGIKPKGRVKPEQCVLPEDRHPKFGSRATRAASKLRKYGVEPVDGARLRELLDADQERRKE